MIKNNEINRDNIEEIICIDSMLFVKEEHEIICDDKNNDIESEKEKNNKDIQETIKEYENLIDEITVKAINEKAIEMTLNILNNDGNQYNEKINKLKKDIDKQYEDMNNMSEKKIQELYEAEKEIDELKKDFKKNHKNIENIIQKAKEKINDVQEYNNELEKVVQKKTKDIENIMRKGMDEGVIEIKINTLNDNGVMYEEKIKKLEEEKNNEIQEKEEESGREIEFIIDGYGIYSDFNNEQDLPNIVDSVIEENYDSNNEKFKVKYMNEVKSNIKNFNQEHQKIILEGADLYITSLMENNIKNYFSKIDDLMDKLYN